MLTSLYIQNYALIKELNISFNSGLSIITGETGAGKSIIMGALSLILGNRSDVNVLQDKEKKCIIEGQFLVNGYALEKLFKKNDLDYDDTCLIRREITPAGKSRAFINDTPVTLPILKEISAYLVDIHSQHQSLLLNDNNFQLRIVDQQSGIEELVLKYQLAFKTYKETRIRLETLQSKALENQKDLDYFQFQFDQLEQAHLSDHEEQSSLESELNSLTHAEDIKKGLSNSVDLIDNDGQSILQWLRYLQNELSPIVQYLAELEELPARIESLEIEMKDIHAEFENLLSKMEIDPRRVDEINERLNDIYSLQQKHRVASIEELIAIKDDLDNKIGEINSYDDEIDALLETQKKQEQDLLTLCQKISDKRVKVISPIEKSIKKILNNLGMPDAKFQISHHLLDDFGPSGKDDISFLFASNSNSVPQPISKVASGGETSRLMLSIKSLLSKAKGMPTIVFDEVDSGVSGDIADKVGDILLDLASGIQVINITHLPQVAVKGNNHFLVYKEKTNGITKTNIRQLEQSERITEIAKMISGDVITPAAIANAKALLNL